MGNRYSNPNHRFGDNSNWNNNGDNSSRVMAMGGSRHTQQSNTVCDPRIHNSPNSLILMGRGNIYNINTVQDTTAHRQPQQQSQPQPQPQPESKNDY